MQQTTSDTIHFRAGGVSLVLAVGEGVLPRVIHWGADLGELDDAALATLVTAHHPPERHNPYDQVWRVGVLPDYASGWLGRPGVQGSRRGTAWSPTFAVDTLETTAGPLEDGRSGQRMHLTASDPVAELELALDIDLLDNGLVRARASLTNTGAGEYQLEALRVVLPVPSEANELLDFTGRHNMERIPQRSEFVIGTHSREQRSGRTGLDAAQLLIAGRAGFGYRSGQLWGMHVAYSGNQELYAERLYNGQRVLGGAELLQSGEMRLASAQSYRTPWIFGSYADGLDAMSARFHGYVRTGAAYPAGPRPVVLNTWEAVYFHHDLAVLTELADLGASVGAERFVLDDGWFGSRRNDSRGLGDWTVSSEVWPEGLSPLIEHVHAVGMDFGLWVEPEMVNTDSDLARAHPEWLFSAGGRLGYPARNQHVLDLTHAEAYAHIRDALLALLAEYDIAYLKWDHNRLLVEAGHTPGGEPAIHAQTEAVYRLMDELRAAQPGLEIESCASGGGRVDLGILEHTQRVWGSDTNDPLERQMIQRGLKLLLPPELIGAHIGASPSHTTGRVHGIDFRGETAFWCGLGLEIDLRHADAAELDGIRGWVSYYRAHRGLLHAGTVVNADHPDECIWISGVVSPDRREALYGVAAIRRSESWPPGLVRLPGLDDDLRYRVSLDGPGENSPAGSIKNPPAWVDQDLVLTGRVLGQSGVQLLPLLPETAYVMRLSALD